MCLGEKDTHILGMFCARDKFNRHRLHRLDMDDIEQWISCYLTSVDLAPISMHQFSIYPQTLVPSGFHGSRRRLSRMLARKASASAPVPVPAPMLNVAKFDRCDDLLTSAAGLAGQFLAAEIREA